MMPQGRRHPALEHLDRLVGEWEVESTHPLLPGTVVRGHATFEWLEGGHFMIWREHAEHPDFPDSTSILGCEVEENADASSDMGSCYLRTFDSRGFYRRYDLGAEAGLWRFSRDWPDFSQRFTGTFSADGDTIDGVAELNRDGSTWEEDLRVTYRRVR